MGDLGIFASKYNINSKSLKEFDEALRFLKDRKEIVRTEEVAEKVGKLLNVLEPLSEAVNGNLSESTAINERRVLEILKRRHGKEWPTYKEKIVGLKTKLNSEKFTLSRTDFDLLNDVGDSLDAECANLFRRMSEQR